MSGLAEVKLEWVKQDNQQLTSNKFMKKKPFNPHINGYPITKLSFPPILLSIGYSTIYQPEQLCMNYYSEQWTVQFFITSLKNKWPVLSG